MTPENLETVSKASERRFGPCHSRNEKIPEPVRGDQNYHHLKETKGMNRKRCLLIALMSSLLLLSCVSMWGQATANYSVQGTITDKTQAVIGNKAEVTLTNKETGAVRTTKTSDTGEYRFDSLSAGMYSLKVT